MLLALPPIEIADDADTLCVRRPHRKGDAALTFVSNHMRAQLFVNSFVLAFAEQVEIHFAERGRKIAWRSTRLALDGTPREMLAWGPRPYVRASDTLRLCAFA